MALSATKLAHLKLTHLHTASTTLFPTSPSISAHLSSLLSSSASKSHIQLADSTWRKTCASCGYAQVPGWTCSVRVRGIGADGTTALEKRDGRVTAEKGIGCEKVPKSTDTRVQGGSGKVRKRGKRTRGARRREKTDAASLAVSDPMEGIASTGRAEKPVRKRKVAPKEPRMVYSCKICDRKTIHSVPIKPATSTNADKPVEMVVEKPVHAAADTATSKPVITSQQEVTKQAMSVNTAPSMNATAKKRAKSRKNTLSEMLAKEAANRSAAAGGGGFGLDLMDFMRTS